MCHPVHTALPCLEGLILCCLDLFLCTETSNTNESTIPRQVHKSTKFIVSLTRVIDHAKNGYSTGSKFPVASTEREQKALKKAPAFLTKTHIMLRESRHPFFIMSPLSIAVAHNKDVICPLYLLQKNDQKPYHVSHFATAFSHLSIQRVPFSILVRKQHSLP